METTDQSENLHGYLVVPLSQGKPIEWKLETKRRPDWLFLFLKVPLSQGKPIEWKHWFYSRCFLEVI